MPRDEYRSSEILEARAWREARGDKEVTVETILDNLARGEAGPDYAAQWASYYRSQGMNNEAVMIETFVRGLLAGRKGKDSSEERFRVVIGKDSLANGASDTCYRCNKSGHFARDCPESKFSDLDRNPRNFPCKDGPGCKFLLLPEGCRYQHDEPPSGRSVAGGSDFETLDTSDLDRRPRNFPCKDGPGCKFLLLPAGCRYQHDDPASVPGGSDFEPLGTSDLDRRPRNFPCKDGPGCKFLSLPAGCRYQHDDLPSGRSVSGGLSAIECYRCNGFGHFARDCPTSAGIRRSALPRGGGPIRGTLAHSSKEEAYTTTLECYLCNKVGHFARDCVRGRGGPEERSLRCLKCHRRGHFAKDCRDEESRCFRCYKSGHIAKDCDEPDLCYYCNKRGHMSRDCPDGDLKTCFKCGGKGHIALDCPSPQQSANSKKGEKGSADDEVLEPEDL